MQAQSFTFGHNFSAENPGSIDDFYQLSKKQLGEGSYGLVFQGTSKASKEVRAVKQIDRAKVKDPKKFEQENSIQKALDHPNIAKLYEVFKDGKYYYLVMEMCTGGELFDHIIQAAEDSGVEGVAFTETKAAEYMRQIMGAMFYMHSNGYVHRDIKPENFLMQSKDKNAEIKVIDFGLAKYNPEGKPMTTKAGTPYYVAPQVLQGSYDDKCDIWSCGVITYILLCGYPPFYGDKDSDILKMVKKGQFDFPSPDWDTRSKEAKDFITQMLTLDATKRPTAENLLQHKWLAGGASDAPIPLGTDAFNKLRDFTSASRLKKLALTVIASEMKAKDIEDLKKLFKGLDKNHDGMLSDTEIKTAIADIKAQGGYTFDPEALQGYLSKLDTDGSGKIDWSEFLASMLDKKNYSDENALWKAFRKFDLDGDGQITKAELKKILTNAGDKDGLSDDARFAQEIDAMMKEGDLDGDGSISFPEFKTMMMKETQ